MKRWRTNTGKYRLRFEDRREFTELLSKLPNITRPHCWHWQCGCGNMGMVEYKGRVYCATCGIVRVANTKQGKVYYTPSDIKNCQCCLQNKR